jgi:Kef-type K+ transport system membrane component KefB
MNEIFSVGLILMAAVLAGHLAQLVRVPEVTGYLLVGVAIGPSALELISHENLTALGFLSEVALGLILFNIGSIFEASNFRRVGRGVVRVTLWEATLAFVLVFITLLMLGMNWPLAVLLAVVAMETAPATTLMVLNEYDAKGPMTERLLALVALNNMYVLVTFGIVSAALTFVQPSNDGWMLNAYRAVHGLGWTIVGSIALWRSRGSHHRVSCRPRERIRRGADSRHWCGVDYGGRIALAGALAVDRHAGTRCNRCERL